LKSIALVRAVVSGNRSVNVVPRPGNEETSTSPPSLVTVSRTALRPTPRPASSSASARDEMPASKIAC
jgi:hypothetical protein